MAPFFEKNLSYSYQLAVGSDSARYSHAKDSYLQKPKQKNIGKAMVSPWERMIFHQFFYDVRPSNTLDHCKDGSQGETFGRQQSGGRWASWVLNAVLTKSYAAFAVFVNF